MVIDQALLEDLLEKAELNPRLRTNLDMRTSPEDGSQRMLNALMPGTDVPIHRHPMSTENILLLKGKMDVVLFEDSPLKEMQRIHLCLAEGCIGCQVPKGAWHTVEVLEPSVIYEGKDGRYGEDGSEFF